MRFTGRSSDLGRLDTRLRAVTEQRGASRGVAVTVTGRRRVGKSRLVQEFCDRSGLPYLVFQATRGRNPAAERADFAAAIARSPLPGAELVAGSVPADWNQALRNLAIATPADTPCVVVLDEVPWLVEQDNEFEGALQTVWDRQLSARPVLLLLVGSDRVVMEALQSYGRPFFGRAAAMVVEPLNLADIQDGTRLPAGDAVDAALITGGFPELVVSWRPETTPGDFLLESLADPLSPLLVAGELSLLGEFPEPSHARAVLAAIGSGERTFSGIAGRVGGDAPLPSGTLAPVLSGLLAKRVIAVDQPVSTRPETKNKRYRIADPYLRFWLGLLQHALSYVERGRSDLAMAHIDRNWSSWRGRAVEPLVRRSVFRLLGGERWPDVRFVGGWWNRKNNPEVDLVGADRASAAGRIHFVGSIKWLDRRMFDRHDLDVLAADAPAIPGVDADTPRVVVSRGGAVAGLPLAACWGPEDLVDAWRQSA